MRQPGSSSVPAQLTDYRLQQRDYLLKIARAMSERLDLREVLMLVIRSAVEMTGGQAGAIAMGSEDDSMEVSVSYRLEERFVDNLEPVLRSEPSSATHQDDADAVDAVTSFIEFEPNHRQQVLSLPLSVSGERIGRIVVLRSDGAAVFTPLDSELLQAFADQAAVAIQNARLHEELAARERKLDAIVRNDPTALVLVDDSGRIVTANPALEEVTRCSCSDAAGMRLDALLALETESGEPMSLDLPEGPGSAVARGFLRTQDRYTRPFVQITVIPLSAPGGQTKSYVASVVDISAFREAEQAKRSFLAGLSHELKTPLSLIKGYAETLGLEHVRQDDALYEESLRIILDETERLTAMVERLLQAARLEEGAPQPQLDELDVGPIILEIVEQFRRADPGHDWQATVHPDIPMIRGDRLQLRQVFQNLLSNAGKFSNQGTAVDVVVEAAEEGVSITVSDEGVGLDARNLDRVFERFYRASDGVEGTGLGLYMSRAIVEAHGGSISVDSTPGAGSTFVVRLPRSGPTADTKEGSGT